MIAGGRILLVGILLLSLTGCSAVRKISTRGRPEVMPTAAQLQAALEQRRAQVRSLRALARLQYRHPEGPNVSREAIVVERPDRLRVEVLSMVLGAVFVLTARDNAFTAYARGEDKIYRGVASPQNMWRYARIGLPIVDLVDLVLGTPPQRPATWTHVTFDSDTGWVQLSQDVEGGVLIVWFEDTLPRAAEMRDSYGEVQWRAMFSKYEEHDGIAIATRIRAEVPDRDHSVKIDLDDIDLNPTLDPATFTFIAPKGAEIVDLDEGTGAALLP